MLRTAKVASVLVVCVLLAVLHGQAEESRHALLVGCSKYVHYPHKPLPGAANDVASFRKLLQERFAFSDDNVTTLVGWPDEVKKRPTYENIRAAFDELVSRAVKDDQIVIYLSGHGCLRKTEKPDPDEPDGYDEAFVPADQRMNGDVILDNQVGRWLRELNQKGAHVWIIFDSCFSGTMTRGGGASATVASAPVVSRGLEPAPERPALPEGRYDGLDIPKKPDSSEPRLTRPSLVAFYAAQEFEEAVEVIRPFGADQKDVGNRHGLMSYHIEQALRQQSEGITYGELGRILVSRYRADGRIRPTPFFEGDLGREVLGIKEWPPVKPLFLETTGDGVRLSAGEFAGVTAGSVLAVFRPEDRERETPLGHIRVTQATATAATVESAAFGQMAARDINTFPDNAHCQIVSQDFGDHRIRLAFASLPGPDSADLLKQLETAVRPMLEKQAAIVAETADLQTADWALVPVPPAAALKRFNVRVDEPAVFLVPGDVARAMRQSEPGELSAPLAAADKMRVHYRLADVQQNALPLEQDLRRIFSWHNIWRIAGAYGEGSTLAGRREIRLEIETSSGTAPSRLVPGDSVKVSVVNRGYKPYWYTVLFLNERFGIQHERSRSIERRPSTGPPTKHELLSFNVSSKLSGTNGFVIIAVSQKEHQNQPSYQFLGQPMLGAAGKRPSVDTSKLTTPFEKLLLSAVSGGSGFRSSVSPDKPQLASWSWVTVAAEDP